MSQQVQVKVTYQNETKKFRKPESYDVLLQQTIKAFGSTLPKTFKFFYQDPDGDLISISCQEDLEEAYSSMPALKLIVEGSIQEARNVMEPDFSMRSSMTMPMQMHQQVSRELHQVFEQIPSIPHISEARISEQFEELGRYAEEQKSISYHQPPASNNSSHSIAIGGDDNINTSPVQFNAEAGTDAVDQQNFGCNTQIQTDEKQHMMHALLIDIEKSDSFVQLNAVVDTKDIGSQIIKEVKEASCDGFVQTESKGSQFKAEGVSQEINCQIIRPENEEEQISDDEGMICFKCDGTKVNKKGVPCRKCNGSGTLQNKFYKDLVKVVKEEVKSYTTQTFQRLMVDYLGKKASDQATQVHDQITCDGCGTKPIQGIRYKCSVCEDFDYCDKCEAQKPHNHPFLKIRKPEQAPAFIACKYSQLSQSNSSSQNSAPRKSQTHKKPTDKKIIHQARFVKESFGDRHPVYPGQRFIKSWTFRNGGEADWPEDTLFVQTNGDEFHAVPFSVKGPVKPGQEVEISLDLVAPQLPGNFIAFFRFVHGDNNRFGQKVWCDILVAGQAPAPAFKGAALFFGVPQVIASEPHQERSSLLNFDDIVKVPEQAANDDIFDRVSKEQEVHPSLELSQAHYEEKPVAAEESKEEKSSLADPEPEAALKVSQVSTEELDKIAYLEKVKLVKDSRIVESLNHMLLYL